METVSVRLERLKELDFIGKILNEKRSKLIRKLLFKGREMEALELYKKGKVSLGLGAKLAGVPLSEFIDLLKEYQVPLNLELEDAKEAMRYAEKKL
jgi:predicted HTH domain antitoxin